MSCIKTAGSNGGVKSGYQWNSNKYQKKLGGIFERVGYLELDFWNMAYRRKKA
ncbi:MAG: hypothetical protein K2K90_15320 [Lachnospiraceae bacterium]|jgi:thiaminase|nr:hypothetical protein [Lachnospiraceae bacterium]